MLDKFLRKGTEADASIIEEQKEQLAKLQAELTEQASLLADALAKVAEFEAAANEAKAQAEAAAREAAEMKIAQRKVALGNVIGSENPSFDAIFGAVAALDDAAFDAFVGAHVMRNEQEAQSDGFKEVGFSVDPKDVKMEEASISETERILRDTFNQSVQ